jgi:hypothetical protein
MLVNLHMKIKQLHLNYAVLNLLWREGVTFILQSIYEAYYADMYN